MGASDDAIIELIDVEHMPIAILVGAIVVGVIVGAVIVALFTETDNAG